MMLKIKYVLKKLSLCMIKYNIHIEKFLNIKTYLEKK